MPHPIPRNHREPSVFTAANLLRDARRQRFLKEETVPEVCVLDPDGDLVRHLRNGPHAERSSNWACYHTELWLYKSAGGLIGVVGLAVGAPFSVLVAEELFASGCRLLVSITSAGQLRPMGTPPYFVLIKKALRDEGTSGHYLPTSLWSTLPTALADFTKQALLALPFPVHEGASWTTDAPFRETNEAITAATLLGADLVEMEAAALYAFGEASGNPILCFAQVTNEMAMREGDFDKGDKDGATDLLSLISELNLTWRKWK
ncbi:MAG: nucleoside phosphorylase [Spirochaetes bacterium]|nr:nucleoside phosphorylase [Spirochaetota bacterium]